MNHKKVEINWPKPEKRKIYPFFIPFLGCKKRCIFCAQDIQTGKGHVAIENSIKETRKNFLSSSGAWDELAFYGGTFSALPEGDWQTALKFAVWAIKEGFVRSFRCSTRPDTLPERRVAELRDAGCSVVELGIQTFCDEALSLAKRGYTRTDCEKAISLLKKYELKSGVQLMPGFPYTSAGQFYADVKIAIELATDIFRFYPCLVFKNTSLAQLWEAGAYKPWDLATAIKKVAQGWLLARKKNKQVIRMGVAEQDRLAAEILAGPVHNAFGNLVMAEALFKTIGEMTNNHSASAYKLYLPLFAQGYLWGYKKGLKPLWQKAGFDSSNIFFIDQEKIILEFEQY